MHPYTNDFYAKIGAGSRRSAELMLPLVLHWVQPRSVVDVGCGIGAWLAVARAHGITDVLGMDGAYVNRSQLQIPAAQFLSAELNAPPRLDRQFDLVLSLEVAEHLPAAQAADFIAYLTGLGAVVLFSAAAPRQGGDGHLNEQWPAYWAALFAAHGFRALDCLRPRFWNCPELEFWYAQNTVLYVHADHARLPELLTATAAAASAPATPLPLIHPQLYRQHYDWLLQAETERRPPAPSLRETLMSLPGLLRQALQRRWQRVPLAAYPAAAKTERRTLP